jgi:hypothetical protein
MIALVLCITAWPESSREIHHTEPRRKTFVSIESLTTEVVE